jgi:hypothetical protein
VPPAFYRMSLVFGIAAVAAGAYGRREWDTESDFVTLGVVALMAAGFLAALTGLYGLLREQPPTGEDAAERQRIVDRAAWRATVPPVLAGVTMLAFFALTDRWDNLANPVQSQVALFAGILGAVIGIVIDRITRWDLLIVPIALIVALIAWGDRLPLESETTSKGEMVTLLVIVVLIVGIVINVPQIARGRRPSQQAS